MSVPLAFCRYLVPEVEVMAVRVLAELAPKMEPAAMVPRPVPPLPTVRAVVVRVSWLKLPVPVVTKLPVPEKLLAP